MLFFGIFCVLTKWIIPSVTYHIKLLAKYDKSLLRKIGLRRKKNAIAGVMV